MKPRKYTPSKRVRNHIAKWEASDFAGQNAAFGGDAVGAKAIELMDMLGDKANAFTDNELDGLLSTYYNLSPRGFRKTLMPYIDAYAADLSDVNKKGLDLAMRDRWRIAAKKYQRGIRRRANADADLMGLSYQDPIVEQPDVIKRTNIVVPEENTEATWKGAENVSPYVTGKPIIKLQPRLKLPPIEELMEDSAWEPSFRLNPRGYKNGKSPEVVITPDQEYNQYLNTLPDNQRLTPESLYRSHRYWELNGKPKSFAEAIGKGMFNYDTSDHLWHANSVTFNENTGEYEFMKPNWHSTKMYEDAFYYSKDGEEFRKNYIKKPGVAYDKYIPKHADGKLPKYEGGKLVIGSNVNMNDDGTFTDDYTRVFDDLVVTPEGPRIKPGQLYKYQEPWDDEKFTNAVTLGGLNNLSPALWVGRLSDVISTANGDMNFSTLSNRWLYGNPGTFSISKPLEKYSVEHPNAANAANMLFDFWTLGGPSILRNARNINMKDLWRLIDADPYRMNDHYIPDGSNHTGHVSPLKQVNKTVEEIKPVNSTNITNNSNISPVKHLEQDEPLSMIDTSNYRDRRIFRQYEQDLPDIAHMEDEWRNGGYLGSRPRLLPYLLYANMSSEDAFKLIFGDARVDPETGRKYFMVLPQYKDFVTLRGVSKPWGYSFSGVLPASAYDKSWAVYHDIPNEIKNGKYLIVPDEASLLYALGTAAQPVKNKIIKPKLSKDRVDWSDYKKLLSDKINEDWEQNGPLRSHLLRSGITNPDILMDYMITPEQAWNMSMKDPGLNIGQMLFNSQVEDEIFRNGIFLKSFNQSLNKILKSRGYTGMLINTDNIITKRNVLNQVLHHTNKANATKKIMSAAFHDVLKRDPDAAKEFYTLVDNTYDNAFASTNKGVMYIPPKTSNFGRTVSHEMGHLEDMNIFGDDPVYGIVESTQNTIAPKSTSDLFKKAFDLSKLDESTAKYFGGVFSNSTEMALRATQIADYLGLKKGEPITPEKLRYAINNYIKDTGMDNNMSEFFSTIKDVDAAAKWMSAFHKAAVPGAIGTATYKALQPRKKKKQ